MILFPVLKGARWPRKTPATWSLLTLNVVVALITFGKTQEHQTSLDQMLTDAEFLYTQGKVFSQFVQQHPEDYSRLLKGLARRASQGDRRKQEWMGYLALRDPKFAVDAAKFHFHGDQVALNSWRTKFEEIKAIQATHPSYFLGINSDHLSYHHWITYQFAHGSFSHLLINMAFLIIFGTLLELTLGSVAVLLIYILGGALGALLYIFFSGLSVAPLVGASGSVSALMGLCALLYWNKRVKYYYFVLPFKGYNGFIYLPGWVILLIFTITDLSGFLRTVPEIGGVAHMAHLGGAFFGMITALVVWGLTVTPVFSKTLGLKLNGIN